MPKPFKKRVITQCPCGSGRLARECHVDRFDGLLRKQVPSLEPSSPKTAYSHEQCYLHDTSDCSAIISREHYISETVLRQLGKRVAVSGMPWQARGSSQEIGIANLTAKILCERHNNALSPLDAEAGLFFSILQKKFEELGRRSLSQKPVYRLVSGEGLELWMLKVACGLYYSVATDQGVRLPKTHTIDMLKIRRAFFERRWDSGGGLYLSGNQGSVIRASAHAGFKPLGVKERFVGVGASLHGLELDLFFDTDGMNPVELRRRVHRPAELLVKRGKRQWSTLLTWPAGTPTQTVVMDRRFGE